MDGISLTTTVETFKGFVERKEFSNLKRIPLGSECACYILYSKKMYNKVILKTSQDRSREDTLLKKFGHLKSIPQLYWSDSKNSIVEYFFGEQACYARPTQEQLNQLIEDYYFIAVNGYLLSDMSVSNILYNEENGFKIIDLGDYDTVSGLSSKELYERTESRFWGTLSSCTKADGLDECKEYAKSVLQKYAEFKEINPTDTLASSQLIEAPKYEEEANIISVNPLD